MKRILIANRGEIAVRIARSCQKLGIETVVVYSSADAFSPHAACSPLSFELPGVRAEETYLNIEKILQIAKLSEADAIHPGYGFLSENSQFAAACKEAGIIFIGPRPETLQLLGDKSKARKLAQKLEVPVVPGYQGENCTKEELLTQAEAVGFPLMIKARAGGGGRGMRLVFEQSELSSALDAATKEAESFFSDGTLLLERFVPNARHIEVQILGDGKGNVLHFFERDCSLQRKFQKIIEEAPARGLPNELRESLYSYAKKLATESSLLGLATVEFLVSVERKEIFFLEVNPRLQVEHPITECITGIDLVELQVSTVRDGALPLTQDDIRSSGHAIEARVYAEIPQLSFRPSTGRIQTCSLPEPSSPSRIDHALCAGLEVTPHYDSLLAKSISHAPDINSAILSSQKQLQEILITGIDTNISFLLELLEELSGSSPPSTTFITSYLESNTLKRSLAEDYIPFAAACYMYLCLHPLGAEKNPFTSLTRWRDYSTSPEELSLLLHCGSFQENSTLDYSASFKESLKIERTPQSILISPEFPNLKAFIAKTSSTPREHLQVSLSIAGHMYTLQPRVDENSSEESELQSANELRASMPGTVLEVRVSQGQEVSKGSVVLSIESMKMEHLFYAPRDAQVDSIHVEKGALVSNNEVLITFKKETSESSD